MNDQGLNCTFDRFFYLFIFILTGTNRKLMNGSIIKYDLLINTKGISEDLLSSIDRTIQLVTTIVKINTRKKSKTFS